MQCEPGEEVVPSGLQSGETHSGDADKSRLLWDDLHITQRVEQRDVGSS
jgi:hypothetical protein